MEISETFRFLIIWGTMIPLYVCAEYLLYNDSSVMSELSCRTERGVYLSLEEYKQDTCARCYFYLPPYAFKNEKVKLRYDEQTGRLVDPASNISYVVDPDEEENPAYKTFESELFIRKWLACCREALDCCSVMIAESLFGNKTELIKCPRTWDGWQCWPDTPAGKMAQVVCQEHIYFRSEPPPCPNGCILPVDE